MQSLFLDILLSNITMAQSSLPAAPAVQVHIKGIWLLSTSSPLMVKCGNETWLFPHYKFALLIPAPMIQEEEHKGFSCTAPSLMAQHSSILNKLRNCNVWVKTARQNLLQVLAPTDAQNHTRLPCTPFCKYVSNWMSFTLTSLKTSHLYLLQDWCFTGSGSKGKVSAQFTNQRMIVRPQALGFMSQGVEQLGDEPHKGQALMTLHTGGSSSTMCPVRGHFQPVTERVRQHTALPRDGCSPSQALTAPGSLPPHLTWPPASPNAAPGKADKGNSHSFCEDGTPPSQWPLQKSREKKHISLLLAAQSHKAFYTHLSSSFHVKALMMNFKHHLMYHGSFLRCLWRAWSLPACWTGLVWH